MPLTVIVRPAHAGSPAAPGDIVVVRRLRVRDGCARMRNETEERRAMDIPESSGLCIAARRRMRRIGHAVVPAVARAVIDGPGAPGPAAGGWRRSPDRRAPRRRRRGAQQRRRPPPGHAADDDDPGAGVAPQCLLRRAAPRPSRAARPGPPAPSARRRRCAAWP